jgi:NDP-sugar pyrophosphorylase family protein
MKAVILAAGRGTRMGSLTAELPKPMVRVQGKPILETILAGLRDHAGVREAFLVVGYQADVIRAYFGDGQKWGVKIFYGVQEVQDGTGKAPETAKEWIGSDPFLLTCGDMLLADPSDYARLVAAFEGDGVLALKAGEDLTKGGAVVLDSRGWMVQLLEKAPADQIPENAYYNLATYVLTPRLFEFTARLEKSPRNEYELTDALRSWVAAGGRLKGVLFKNKWVDVRDPETLAALNQGC